MAVTDMSRRELLQATDQQIDDAVKYADPMVLRGLLYQLTGDEEIASTKLKWVRVLFLEALTVETDDEVYLREKAAEFLKAYRDAGAGKIEIGPEERLRVSIGLTVATELEGDRLALTIEELGLHPGVRDLDWREAPDSKRLAGFSVTVVGAGLGGLTAALMLKRAGIPFTVVEKNSGVGGTWFENRYPGAGGGYS